MDNTEYKRSVMWLLMLPPEKRKDAVEKLLDLLKLK